MFLVMLLISRLPSLDRSLGGLLMNKGVNRLVRNLFVAIVLVVEIIVECLVLLTMFLMKGFRLIIFRF